VLNVQRNLFGLGIIGVIVGGCGGPRLSQVGDTCRTTDDCASPNVCISSVCEPVGWKPTPPTPPRLSQVGESCQVSADCAGTAVCEGGSCKVASYGITANSKECILQECTQPVDCCPTPSTECATLEATCQL
jgi:hypothetical protein